jgi:hypothetical protein
MKPGKENNKGAPGELNLLINQFRKKNPHLDIIIKGEDSNRKRENQAEVHKEIIRRLRIQNTKLLEQVNKLKEELKKRKYNRIQVINHINELFKLIDR